MESHEKLAIRVSINTLACNIVLSFFKLFAGIFAHSAAMVSDSVHSFSDCLAEVIVIIGIKMSNKQSDKEHPYGHERMECVAAIILAFILFSVGILIGGRGMQSIITGEYGKYAFPGLFALIAAAVSIIVKESMFWYTQAASIKINSVALKASAWHHRSDALSSIGSFAGILGARLGFPVLDAAACVIISLFIVKASANIFMDAIGKMTDKACDDTVINELCSVILAQKSVEGIDQINTRLFGNKIYVDLEIRVNGSVTLNEAHNVAQCVHDAIEAKFSKIKHCMVHVNPVNVLDKEI